MAELLWGKVYFHDIYAGKIQEEPGGRILFIYDDSYLQASHPAIAHTLPLQGAPHISESGVHSFFDNLVAEGWLMKAQAKALGLKPEQRFGLLLGFGADLAGAVSVIDPKPRQHQRLDHADNATIAALLGKASLSGIQRKLLVVKEGNDYRPVGRGELSTHIAKLSSGNLAELIELEYLTTEAIRCLLPDDQAVNMEIASLPSVKESALIISRFDRVITGTGVKRAHFEEFNQLLGRQSDNKYEGAYEEMGQFIVKTPGCIPAEADRLLRRVFACFLTGNTDAHFKNFAMFHTRDGLRLTPSYDLAASSIYPDYQTVALSIAGAKNFPIGSLKTKHLLRLGKGFGLTKDATILAIESMGKNLSAVLEIVSKSDVGSKKLRDQLIKKIEKRWNGSFKLTGKLLS